ncbi:ribosomal L1 domain-containing 1 [Stemphylium lycopersici]|nr:palmitoyl-protein thioesterase 1 precursor [Stemphylium lycopersici]RAR04808.1 ribosomal L1 domain-containing 1 [Stemphylium lycopersici]
MAKSKTVTKKTEKATEAPLTTKTANGTPYQLDPAQVERAAKALVAHMKKHVEQKQEEAPKKSLAADEDEPEEVDEPIFLSLSTKKQIGNTKSLKPVAIKLPHPIIAEDVRICIFTKDPQRAYKDLVASDAFPAALRGKVQRVLGVDKLKKRYKAFEQKRALLAEYDVFMVDDRVIKIVAECLGKVFYKSKSKRPIPIRLTAGAYIDKSAKKDAKEPQNVVGTSQGVAKEVESALNSTYLSMSPSANTSIKVANLSMTPQQVAENTAAVVSEVINKHVGQGWRNVRSLHVKGPATKALPIWLADELWVEDSQVRDGPYQGAITDGSAKGKSAERKRKWDEWEEELLDDEALAAKQARREAKKAKKTEKKSSISKEKRKAMKQDALHESKPLPLLIWHGLGDNYAADGLHSVGDLANETNPGTFVYYIRLDEDAGSDRTATFLGNVTEQIAQVCDDISEHKVLSQAPGLNALGFSQGGQFLRGLIERCGDRVNIKNLVTFGSQHNGIAKYQLCKDGDWICKGYIGLLKANTWGSWVQGHLVPAQYFKATNETTGEPADEYLEASNFLADINNERKLKNVTYAENLAALDNFVMYVFEDDTTVIPKESGWFAYTNTTSNEVTDLRDRDIYKEDWIGLKKLDEKGGLHFKTTKGGHMDLGDKVLKDVFKTYFSVEKTAWGSLVEEVQEVMEL